MSKSEEIENMVLKLYDLVLNPEIKEKERILLIDAKTGLEKGQYYPKVINNLERSLRPLAIRENCLNQYHRFIWRYQQ